MKSLGIAFVIKHTNKHGLIHLPK